MRRLYSAALMATSTALLAAGCVLRVGSEVLAYQDIAHSVWTWLPISAVVELTAVTLFAANLIATFLTKPPSARLVELKRPAPATAPVSDAGAKHNVNREESDEACNRVQRSGAVPGD